MQVRWSPGRRAIAVILAVVCLTMATVGTASAGRPDSVDPALMSPPLNSSFSWECWRVDDRIVCDGERTLTYTALDAFPCPDGGSVYASGIDQRTMRRIGDVEGKALSTFETVRIEDRVSRSPQFDGIIGRGIGIWTDSYEYVVPGDLSSRIVTRRGADVLVTIPGQGVVLSALDVGIKSWDIEDTILFERGPHALVEDIEGAFEAMCDALGGEN